MSNEEITFFCHLSAGDRDLFKVTKVKVKGQGQMSRSLFQGTKVKGHYKKRSSSITVTKVKVKVIIRRSEIKVMKVKMHQGQSC